MSMCPFWPSSLDAFGVVTFFQHFLVTLQVISFDPKFLSAAWCLNSFHSYRHSEGH